MPQTKSATNPKTYWGNPPEYTYTKKNNNNETKQKALNNKKHGQHTRAEMQWILDTYVATQGKANKNSKSKCWIYLNL